MMAVSSNEDWIVFKTLQFSRVAGVAWIVGCLLYRRSASGGIFLSRSYSTYKSVYCTKVKTHSAVLLFVQNRRSFIYSMTVDNLWGGVSFSAFEASICSSSEQSSGRSQRLLMLWDSSMITDNRPTERSNSWKPFSGENETSVARFLLTIWRLQRRMSYSLVLADVPELLWAIVIFPVPCFFDFIVLQSDACMSAVLSLVSRYPHFPNIVLHSVAVQVSEGSVMVCPARVAFHANPVEFIVIRQFAGNEFLKKMRPIKKL